MSRHSIVRLLVSRLIPAGLTGMFVFMLVTHATLAQQARHICAVAGHTIAASKDYILTADQERQRSTR